MLAWLATPPRRCEQGGRVADLQRENSGICEEHGPAVVEQAEQIYRVKPAGEAQQRQRPRRQRLGADVGGHHHGLSRQVKDLKGNLHPSGGAPRGRGGCVELLASQRAATADVTAAAGQPGLEVWRLQ